ncbi:MAG TPA: DUF177 domain-containing protein [Patescibacteria group bacterium]|nr:DUF177 domain-containing protein [Patescibacteria group bacterium]
MIALELSRPVSVVQLGTGEKTFKIETDAAEREALAKRFDIVAVTALTAVVRLKVLPGGAIVRLLGRFQADVVQSCVISLDPVPAHLDEEFELTYGPEPDDEAEEIVLDLDAQDPPEPIVDGEIDIGEAVAEHLALALEPFPRAPGAVFAEGGEEPAEAPRPNPFAVLAGLKKK